MTGSRPDATRHAFADGIVRPPWTAAWPAPGCEPVVLAVAPLDWAPPGELHSYLGAGERTRLASFRAPERQRRYLAGHALLHRVARGFGTSSKVERAYNGQPLLAVNGLPLAASISHAGPLVAAAAGPVAHLGIDLEYPPDAARWRRIARRYGWPAEESVGLRTRRWSLWEASGKARGLGVFRAADRVFEALQAEESGRVEGGNWQHAVVPLPDGGVLVAAIDGADRSDLTVTPGLPG